MKLFFTITKKSLCITLCAVVVLFLTAMWSYSLRVSVIDGSTHAKRMTYLSGLSVNVDEKNWTSKETVIPEKFGAVYTKYNELQKQAGFDLSSFKGKEVTVYSYPLINEEKVVTLIVCNNIIIGGDIAETKLDGKMEPLN